LLASTTLLIERAPTDSRRFTNQAGLGPIFTPRITTPMNRRTSPASATRTTNASAFAESCPFDASGMEPPACSISGSASG
jgi:hypothetical protein